MAERISAGVGALLVVVLVAWLLVPGSGPKSTNLATGAGAAGGAGAGGAGAGAGAAGDTGAAAAGGGAAAGASGAATGGAAGAASKSGAAAGANGASAGGAVAAGCPAASGVTGVSNTQIKVAVTLTNIVGPAANSIFGIASPADQQKWYEAVIDDLNKAGGVGCRKIVPTFYPTNPSDQNELQQRCLQIAQSGVFAEIDNGAYAIYPQKHCFGQKRIPFFGGYMLFQDEIDAFYPYLFNISNFDTIDKNTVFALKDRGFFNIPGKLGFTYRNCDQPLVNKWFQWFQQAGIPSSQIVTYNFGCPAVFASPSDIQAAVLKFEQAGVTHMTAHQLVGDFSNFSNVAQQQNFHPKYGLPDESMIDVAYGSQAPNPANIVDAIAIAQGRSGEERTPGAAPSGGTTKCNTIYQAHGIQPTYKLPAGAGYVCDQLWMFQAAVNNAPVFRAEALAAGLARAQSIDFSYPGGPNNFTGTRATTGGQFWRVAQFMASCKCWQVVDPAFHPSYP
jgi:hypothetical protein